VAPASRPIPKRRSGAADSPHLEAQELVLRDSAHHQRWHVERRRGRRAAGCLAPRRRSGARAQRRAQPLAARLPDDAAVIPRRACLLLPVRVRHRGQRTAGPQVKSAARRPFGVLPRSMRPPAHRRARRRGDAAGAASAHRLAAGTRHAAPPSRAADEGRACTQIATPDQHCHVIPREHRAPLFVSLLSRGSPAAAAQRPRGEAARGLQRAASQRARKGPLAWRREPGTRSSEPRACLCGVRRRTAAAAATAAMTKKAVERLWVNPRRAPALGRAAGWAARRTHAHAPALNPLRRHVTCLHTRAAEP
jgi:hypothetical protein